MSENFGDNLAYTLEGEEVVLRLVVFLLLRGIFGAEALDFRIILRMLEKNAAVFAEGRLAFTVDLHEGRKRTGGWTGERRRVLRKGHRRIPRKDQQV